MGCDRGYLYIWDEIYIFQSTHPSWGATGKRVAGLVNFNISIHAPIVGCDLFLFCNLHVQCSYFNPRTHRGVRRYQQLDNSLLIVFQSTHPSWGATLNQIILMYFLFYFNPRTHRGVRPSSYSQHRWKWRFQSTHPSWGATSVKGDRK